MSPRPDVSEARREQILDAAETVFSESGMAQARMDDIGQEAGLSKGALYWYYKSKDAIILALLDRVFAAELKHAAKLIDRPVPAGERLLEFLRLTLEDMAKFSRLLPLGFEFFALAARREAVREAVVGYYRSYHELLTHIIQQGVDAGEFIELDVNQAATQVIALVEGLALIWVVDPDLVDIRELSDSPMHTLLNGFRVRSTGG